MHLIVKKKVLEEECSFFDVLDLYVKIKGSLSLYAFDSEENSVRRVKMHNVCTKTPF